MKKLLSFVGTGKYSPTRYQLEGIGELHTPYVAEALASLLEVDEVTLLATDAARRVHGEGLSDRFTNRNISHRFIDFPEGRSEAELWQQFEILRRESSCDGEDTLYVDITHGFRTQPFFAGSVLSLLRATSDEQGSVRILYGEFQPAKPETSPIWDISMFLEVLDWSHALGLFLETGVAAPAVALARRNEQQLRVKQHREGGKDWPQFGGLAKALDAFANDLAAVRIAALITGYENDPKKRHSAKGSASRLMEAIERYRPELTLKLPPLAGILDRIHSMASPLNSPTLHGQQGQQSLANLTRLYLELGRLPEAAITLREGHVSSFGKESSQTEINAGDFNRHNREQLDKHWSTTSKDAKTIADIRNDIEHGGFNNHPKPATVLRKDLTKLVDQYLERQLHVTYFITRHPGAIEWAERQGIHIDQRLDHLAVEQIQPGDRVLGTLPANLAAEVCARGGEYYHLALQMPAEARGRELTADDLESYGAKLQRFHIEAIKDTP